MENAIRDRYPTTCRLFARTHFDADITRAAELAAKPGGRDRLEAALRAGEFRSARLVSALASAALPDPGDHAAAALEHDLTGLVDRLGESKVRKVYGNKLLVDKQFEDAVYEVAVAAVCSGFFRPGTLEPEGMIAGSRSGKKNSDIEGERGGRKYRVEVTVLHNDWPPRMDEQVREIIEGADIGCGYSAQLARPVSRAEAEEVRRLVEKLDAARRASPGTDLEVDGVEYRHRDGEYRCRMKSAATVARIRFDDETPVRLVCGPVYSRNTVDPHEWAGIEADNPEGVTTSTGVRRDPVTHQVTPASTKIWQTLEKKLTQCEPGAVSIVVLGLPNPTDDRACLDALTGAEFAGVGYTEDESGRRVSGDAMLCRLVSGPFMPADWFGNPEQFVEPFRQLSAVWVLRLSAADPLSTLVLNPNAAVPLDEEAARELAVKGRNRAEVWRGPSPRNRPWCG